MANSKRSSYPCFRRSGDADCRIEGIYNHANKLLTGRRPGQRKKQDKDLPGAEWPLSLQIPPVPKDSRSNAPSYHKQSGCLIVACRGRHTCKRTDVHQHRVSVAFRDYRSVLFLVIRLSPEEEDVRFRRCSYGSTRVSASLSCHIGLYGPLRFADVAGLPCTSSAGVMQLSAWKPFEWSNM